jgi:hypothetical protein
LAGEEVVNGLLDDPANDTYDSGEGSDAAQNL